MTRHSRGGCRGVRVGLIQRGARCGVGGWRRMAWPVAVAAALCGACGGQGQQPVATEATQQTAPVTSLLESTVEVVPPPEPSVPEVLVAELDGTNVGFFAYGDRGDAATGVLAGVRIAVIEDPQAWWKALRDDTPDGMEALPPGYQVKAAAGRVQEAPARIVTTGADGTAVADRATDRSPYLYCALSPDVEDLIAGCSDLQEDAGFYSVYFSAGRAYFISLRRDRRDGSSHYGNFLLRPSWRTDPVKVTFVSRTSLDWADDEYPEGFYYETTELFAVVRDDDIGEWWDAISRDGELALSVSGEFFQEMAAPWGSTEAMSPPVDVPREWFDSAPAEYVAIEPGSDFRAEAMLAPGDYLFCNVGFKSLSGVRECTYEDIADAGDVVIMQSGSELEEFNHIVELSRPKGRRVLEDLEHNRNLAADSTGAPTA